MAGDYKIENFYQGGYSSFDPNKGEGFSGYHGKASDLSTTTDPRTANLIKDVSGKLSAGLQNVELTLITPQTFDSIPKDHLKEVHRLSKLTGTEVSVHGPLVDAAGFEGGGGGGLRWGESSRQAAQRTMEDFVGRVQEVNPQGNGVIVFHTSNAPPSSEWMPTPDGKQYRRLIAVDRQTGNITGMEEDIKYYPGQGREVLSPEEGLRMANNTQWSNTIRDIEFTRESAERILSSTDPHFRNLFVASQTGQIDPSKLSEKEIQEMNKIYSAYEYAKDANLKLNSAFSKAVEIAEMEKDREALKMLDDASKNYGEMIGIKDGKITNKEQYTLSHLDPKAQSNATLYLTRVLEQLKPRQFVPIEEFTKEKASETFGNTAFTAYKRFGDKAPIIAIENPPAGQHAISTGEDLRNLVVDSRKKFAEQLVKREGMSQKQAEKVAEKHIGATWDVGHINMIRKQGFTEKDVIKETEKIAPYVKHIHLSDNFGFEHTELPMGMGNVPLKEMMEKLPEKDVKKVIEAAQWWQHFQTNPFKESLVGVGSPIYDTGSGPMWNQHLGLYQSYNLGMEGSFFPQRNYETFGSTFSRLPKELGGNMGQGGGRMSGTPME